MSVVVKQTLYNTQLIKLKHVDDNELWREILTFRAFDNFYSELDAGFIPLDYQNIPPNDGLNYAAYLNNVFLVKEYIRMGATNMRHAFDIAHVQRSFDAVVIIAKNLYKGKKLHDVLFCEFTRAVAEYEMPNKQTMKIARSIPKKYLKKRISRLPYYEYDTGLMFEIVEFARKV